MWMAFVAILEPRRQLRHNGFRIKTVVYIHVISLEGFDERFGHAVGLRALHPSRLAKKLVIE